MSAVVGVDGGKSGLRLRIVADGYTAVGSGPGFTYTSGTADVANIVDAIRTAFAECGPGHQICRACVGLTGLPGDAALRRALGERLSTVFAAPVILVEDSLTAHAGALGAPGTVLSVGTGTVALSLSPDGSWVRVDGWGAVLGDRGSAYALGLAGLRAAVRGFEGVRERTVLTEALFELLGGRASSDIQHFYRHGNTIENIASFATRVGGAAEGGDAVARALVADAVEDLVLTARRAIDLAGLGETAPVTATGRAIDGIVGRSFAAAMAHAGIQVRAARGTALDGAVALARGDLAAYQRIVHGDGDRS